MTGAIIIGVVLTAWLLVTIACIAYVTVGVVCWLVHHSRYLHRADD